MRLVGGRVTAPVRDLFPERLGLGTVDGVRVYQIQAAALEHRPKNVIDSSNSSWDWQSRLEAFGEGMALPLFRGQRWEQVVEKTEAFLHRDHAGIEVLRYAGSCRYEIRRRKEDPLKGHLVLEAPGEGGQGQLAEAVGFRQRVDGIRITLCPEHLSTLPALPETLSARFRADFYLHRINTSAALCDRINPFLAEWLWQTSLGMVTATALRQRCSLAEAQAHLAGKRVQAAQRVLQHIFQVRGTTEEGEELEGRLTETIRELWADPALVRTLEELEATLWAPPDDEYREWVRRRYVATLAQAFRAAAVARQEEISEDDLSVDVIWSEGGSAEIFLPELNSGGLGQIETVVHELLQAPQVLDDGIRHVLSHCPRSDSTRALLAVLQRAVTEPPDRPLPAAFREVRQAKGFLALERARQTLWSALEQKGFLSSRAAVASVVTRLLRPGSSSQTDGMMALVNRNWRRDETRLRVGIDPRVFAYLCVQREPLKARLLRLFTQISGGVPPSEPQIYALLQQFLLLDCKDSCRECLDLPNLYNDFGRPSREPATLWLGLVVPEVSVDEHPNDWQLLAREALKAGGSVRLSASPSCLPAMTAALPALMAEEVESDFLLLPVSIRRVEKEVAAWKITLQLKEAFYA